MDLHSNVTLRRVRRYNSENDLTNLDSMEANNSVFIFDESVRSLPDVSMGNNSRIIDLEMQVEQITQTLSVANQEVDILTQENLCLKKEIEHSTLIIKSLKSMQSPLTERQRCLSPRIIHSPRSSHREKQKRQLFSTQKPTCEAAVQTDTWAPKQPVRKTSKKIKLSIKPKNKYTNKNLFRKLKIQNKKIKKLHRELRQIKIDTNRIQHKIIECKVKNEIQRRNDVTSNKKLTTNEKKRRVNIFSDSFGSGLAMKLLNQSTSVDIINHCKPGASSLQILRNFYQNTENLQENDLAVIMIGNYFERTMEIPYYEIIRNILKNDSRKFNIILGSVLYDGKNDSIIHKINTELSRLATVTENVKYQELNNVNRKFIKSFMTEEILRAGKCFNSSSSLQFIKANSDMSSNFRRATKITING